MNWRWSFLACVLFFWGFDSGINPENAIYHFFVHLSYHCFYLNHPFSHISIILPETSQCISGEQDLSGSGNPKGLRPRNMANQKN